MKNDPKEKGGMLTITDDLELKDGKPIIPENSTTSKSNSNASNSNSATSGNGDKKID
ncbi:MAG: hypothetical protein KBE91_02950 [Bacteroidia bacterium]|nr:hypothetical protein [Bacteroidia bacterium]